MPDYGGQFGISALTGETRGPQYKTPQQLAAEAEQDRQAARARSKAVADQVADPALALSAQQIAAAKALQESQQGFAGGQAGLNRSADAAKQAAAIAEAGRSQGAGIQAQATSQTQSEAAKRGLQDASDTTAKGLQTEKLNSVQKLQAQAEAAAAADAAQKQGYASATLNQQAQLQAAAEQRRMAALQGLLGGAGFGGGPAPQGPQNPGLSGDSFINGKPTGPQPWGSAPNEGIPGAPPAQQLGGEDAAISAQEDNARTAAFARAKDQAGLIGRSAITGLQNQAAGRGIGAHSGIATNATGQVINQGATQLGDVNREQAISAAANARARASEKLADSTTRRGQNISLINGLANAKAY